MVEGEDATMRRRTVRLELWAREIKCNKNE